jgi:hypothetical protein
MTAEKKSSRAKRSASIRTQEVRRKPWQPPSILETPPPPPGMKYRWLRYEMMGEADKTNIGKKFREGWEPVRPDEVDESFNLPTIDDGKHAGVIGVGGLLLAKMPIETVNERNAYYQNLANSQQRAIDAELRNQSHPVMPIGSPERQTQTTFGNPENKPSSD